MFTTNSNGKSSINVHKKEAGVKITVKTKEKTVVKEPNETKGDAKEEEQKGD
jgi:hypothetical protein